MLRRLLMAVLVVVSLACLVPDAKAGGHCCRRPNPCRVGCGSWLCGDYGPGPFGNGNFCYAGYCPYVNRTCCGRIIQ